MRSNFTMTGEQHAKLLEAMRPVPAMWIGGPPRSVQENANDAWVALGHEMGFDGMTVRGVPGGSEYEFSAEVAPVTRPAERPPADLEYESWRTPPNAPPNGEGTTPNGAGVALPPGGQHG
jgi:hypothetical protein